MYRKSVLSGMLAGAISLTAALAAGKERACVGIVTNYGQEKNHYVVLHGRRKKSLGLMMPLYEGDELILKGCDANKQLSVTIELAEETIVVACNNRGSADCNKEQVVCRGTYKLEKTQSYSLLRNLGDSVWGSIRSLFDDLHEERARTELAALAGRPAAPSSPRLFSAVLGSSESRLAAGSREFFLAWAGGEPPYSVHINSTRTGTVLVQSTNISQPRVDLGTKTFTEGRYRVEISDAAGQTVERSIDVVPPAALPNLPGIATERSISARDKTLLDTVYAAWLLDQNQRLWSLEAYQHVAGSAPENYPAQLLKQKLEGSL